MSNHHLDPTAREFVPTFGGSAAAPVSTLNNQDAFEPVVQEQQQQPRYYNNNYNNGYNNNGYKGNSRGRGRGNNNYHNGGYRGNHHQYDNHRSHYSNDPNVDPLEMEARCEAVIEILQDDKIRNVINPNYDTQDSTPSQSADDNNVESQQFDDEEDLLEMMAMQEECRLEMMKFYIQSQNPSLFENVYHGVSYPENHQANQQPQQNSGPVPSGPSNHTNQIPSSAPPATNTSGPTSVKDQIINDLSVNAPEFDPSQLASLSLNDK